MIEIVCEKCGQKKKVKHIGGRRQRFFSVRCWAAWCQEDKLPEPIVVIGVRELLALGYPPDRARQQAATNSHVAYQKRRYWNDAKFREAKKFRSRENARRRRFENLKAA